VPNYSLASAQRRRKKTRNTQVPKGAPAKGKFCTTMMGFKKRGTKPLMIKMLPCSVNVFNHKYDFIMGSFGQYYAETMGNFSKNAMRIWVTKKTA